MARACDMTSGECISGSKGPKTGTLRAARKSSAAFFCSAVYWPGGIVGRRSWAMVAVVRRDIRAARLTGFIDPTVPSCRSCDDLWVTVAGGIAQARSKPGRAQGGREGTTRNGAAKGEPLLG